MEIRNKFIIIGNPIAGSGTIKKINLAESLLRAKGCNVRVRLTTKQGDAEIFAKEASSLNDTIVIAAGGDGTYTEVANGLIKSSTPMAILPIGTTSVLAREIDIPFSTKAAVEIAYAGKTRVINAGKISYTGGAFCPPEPVRYFLLMAGFGFDGDSVYGVNVKMKRISGQLAYIFSGLNVVMKYKPLELAILAPITNRSDFEGGKFRMHPSYTAIADGVLHARSYIAVVSNAASYGGKFSLSPDANLLSPDLCIFLHHTGNKPGLLKMLCAIITGRSLELKDISYFRTNKISISGSAHVQIDGDYVGRSSADIEIVKDALNLVVPE